MEVTARMYREKLEAMYNSVPSVIDEIIEENEDKIVSMNINQISRHENTDGGDLENKYIAFDGFYKKATETFASLGIPTKPITSKAQGKAYNFTWSGEFFDKMRLLKGSKDNDFSIFSDGQNTNEMKKAFFEGYENLYGLIPENEKKLNWERIYPELMKFLNNHI